MFSWLSSYLTGQLPQAPLLAPPLLSLWRLAAPELYLKPPFFSAYSLLGSLRSMVSNLHATIPKF